MTTKIALTINGAAVEAEVEPRTLLIHFLREQQNLTGSHIGCETSHCGACTIDLNGKSVKSCTVFAVQADGGDLLTVEGLANGAELAWGRAPDSRFLSPLDDESKVKNLVEALRSWRELTGIGRVELWSNGQPLVVDRR